jgi:hypothetical protein
MSFVFFISCTLGHKSMKKFCLGKYVFGIALRKLVCHFLKAFFSKFVPIYRTIIWVVAPASKQSK